MFHHLLTLQGLITSSVVTEIGPTFRSMYRLRPWANNLSLSSQFLCVLPSWVSAVGARLTFRCPGSLSLISWVGVTCWCTVSRTEPAPMEPSLNRRCRDTEPITFWKVFSPTPTICSASLRLPAWAGANPPPGLHTEHPKTPALKVCLNTLFCVSGDMKIFSPEIK